MADSQSIPKYPIEAFDLTTQYGRRRARHYGHDAPLRKPGTPPRDFWSRVKKGEGCWEWTGPIVNGYGAVPVNRKSLRAHRVAYALVNGPIPAGAWVLHSCDNKRCVNPEHLRLGTARDNVRDAIERGLHPVGERSGNAKVTEAIVREIRANRIRYAHKGDWSTRSIAARYGLKITGVKDILSGRSWKHTLQQDETTRKMLRR